MADIDRRLPHRLDRNPSVLGEIRYWGLIATVWLGITGLLAYVVLRDGGEGPWWAWLAIGIGGLVGVGLVWDLLNRAWRGLAGRTPVVEISRHPIGPDGVAQVRVVEPHPGSLAGLTVVVVAGAVKIERVHSGPGVTGVRAAYRISGDVRHQDTLLVIDGHELGGAGHVDRLVELRIPEAVVREPWMWRIAVLQHVRRGPPREHWYPIRVGDAAPSGVPLPEF
jgi:hypothetical protein